MPHPGQSHNVVIYMRASVSVVLTSNTIHNREDVSSIFPIIRFSLPDLILHQTCLCTLWATVCMISLTTDKKKLIRWSNEIMIIMNSELTQTVVIKSINKMESN